MKIRWTYGVTRELSFSRTIVGAACFVLILTSIAVITYVVKGHVPAQEISYFTQPNAEGYLCGSSSVYPGQTFGSVRLNTTFTYTALTSFIYSGQRLQDCNFPLSSVWYQVIAYPISWPVLNWGITVECEAPDALNGVQLSVSTLNYLPNDDCGDKVSPIPCNLMAGIGYLLDILKGVSCWNGSVVGFRVDLNQPAPITLFSSTTENGDCSFPMSFPAQGITNLAISQFINITSYVKGAVVYDFGDAFNSSISSAIVTNSGPYPSIADRGNMAVLPGLLYPCTPQKLVRAPVSTILFDCYTTVSASWSILLFMITLALVHARKNEYTIPHDAESSPPMLVAPDIHGGALFLDT